MSARLLKHLADAETAAGLALEFVAGIGLDGYRQSVLIRSAVERQMEIVGKPSAARSRKIRDCASAFLTPHSPWPYATALPMVTTRSMMPSCTKR